MISNRKKKVLFINHALVHYRVPLFNMLNEEVDLTVATETNYKDSLNTFKIINIRIKTNFGFIRYVDLPDLSLYDVVIFPNGIREIEMIYKLLFKKRSYKIFIFSIGVSASYSVAYDSSRLYDYIGRLIIEKVDGAIFYERYPEVKYIARNPKLAEKISVAYNTVIPNKLFDIKKKTFESFIFIGTLYKEKNIYELIDTYSKYSKKTEDPKKLEIVGDGDEFNNLKIYIKEQGLDDIIILHGKLTDDNELLPIFNRAIACISPGQAGLSVQKSFSYGVPFICSKTAITGGEINSIINRVNGFLYNKDSNSELLEIMTEMSKNESLTNEMSNNAYIYYTHFRNPDIWKRGFLKNIIK